MNRKKGRPPTRDYETSWGEVVPGAYMGKDGRLRPIGSDRPAFGGDERAAVFKMKRWLAEQRGEGETARHWTEVLAMSDAERQRWLSQGRIKGLADGEGINALLATAINQERERLRNLILTDPKQAAVELRIEHLAYHPATPTKPHFALTQLCEEYVNKKRNKQGQRLNGKYCKNLRAFWKELLTICGNPRYVRDLGREQIRAYRDEIMRRLDGGRSPTYVRCRFAAVKAILQYGIDETDDKADCRRTLDECGILRSPADANDPRPITVGEYHALLQHADVPMRAVLLFGLNCGMHNGEVASTLREDVDLDGRTLAARRTKTSNPRVAKLWPRTVDAVRELHAKRPHKSPHVFVTRTGERMTGERVRQRIVTLRRRAGLPTEVNFEGLRDAALTVAVGVDAFYANFFAGHKTGMKDKYVLRQANHPKIVDICQAIEREFFPSDQ